MSNNHHRRLRLESFAKVLVLCAAAAMYTFPLLELPVDILFDMPAWWLSILMRAATVTLVVCMILCGVCLVLMSMGAMQFWLWYWRYSQEDRQQIWRTLLISLPIIFGIQAVPLVIDIALHGWHENWLIPVLDVVLITLFAYGFLRTKFALRRASS